MRRAFLWLAMCLLAANAFADERSDRETAEWKKYDEQAMNVCVAGGSVYFTYTPLDRHDWFPVEFSKDLQPDVVKHAANVAKIWDLAILKPIDDEVNPVVNQHLAELRDGTYNKIEIDLPHAPRFAITPANLRGDMLVWVPAGKRSRGLTLFGGVGPANDVYVMHPDGTGEKLTRENRPTWLRTEELVIATETPAGTHRAHTKRLTSCK